MSAATITAVQKMLLRTPRSESELKGLATKAHVLAADELSYLIMSIPPTKSALLFLVLDKSQALAVFQQLSASDQAELIGSLQTNRVTEIVTALDPDDRASLFGELPAAVVKRLMQGLDHKERQMTASLLGYPKDAVGRYMSPEVLSIRADYTVGEAFEYVRDRISEPETIYVLPVVDDSRRLLGVTSLRRLLSTDVDVQVSQIASNPVKAHVEDNHREAAHQFRSQKLLAMPIVDSEERLVGVLTIDDALSILDIAEARDAARTGGAEPLSRSYLAMPIMQVVRSRIIWLLVLALSAILTVQVLEIFEDRLNEVVILALFIPLLTGTAGNTGNQAATTVTRALAVGTARVRDLPRIIWRELRVGATLGLVLGALGFVIAGLVYGPGIGAVIGLTLLSICTMAACVGGVMPLIAKKIGADPAVFSNPFISTFCDATGLVIYFLIATAILNLG